MPGAI